MHNIFFLITLFPGMLLLLTKWIPVLSRKSTFFQYLLCLFLITIMNSLFFRQQFVVVLSLICILFLPFILFFVEYIFVERQWKKLLTIYKKNKIIIQSIVWFPVLEEIIFRFFIYQYCELFDFSNIQYILLATFSFVIAHIFYQGVSSIVKILFSFILSILFLLTLNIFLTIIIHCIFNFLVYIVRTSKYEN
ncbi:TPA: CPBP family intramembrane metalloprotease, partial [Listeria monocytogenes]|nr:CPBP family intramembrane metalloprotease [Listeria monocytogenes]EDO1058993.1 CPBP family intramembrane metalloprotease [Listeria monocytogenes]EDO1088372.1 CPBP family intramembrane metalloprotease [Listeria monocytogenes]EGL4208049.1 CPBP family intramembrane metalloprotease [Listeria monocytogenes]EGL8566208.1 CPBP family intramembrane metalloprotease [Listeria monocytogenes]